MKYFYVKRKNKFKRDLSSLINPLYESYYKLQKKINEHIKKKLLVNFLSIGTY